MSEKYDKTIDFGGFWGGLRKVDFGKTEGGRWVGGSVASGNVSVVTPPLYFVGKGTK